VIGRGSSGSGLGNSIPEGPDGKKLKLLSGPKLPPSLSGNPAPRLLVSQDLKMSISDPEFVAAACVEVL